MTAKPGDWVRFQRNGNLVIGVVAYVGDSDTYPYKPEAITDIGSVLMTDILEVRAARLSEGTTNG